MTIDRFLEEISFPEEGRETIRQMRVSPEEYEIWKRLFYQDELGFEKKMETCREKEKHLLWFYTKLAVEVYNDFHNDGINDQVYFDTFYDFTIWYRRCLKTRGVHGLIQEKWLSLPLKRKIYRLGRLQFEPGVLSGRYDGEPALHVHIPEGEKLDTVRCLESLEQADQFFDDSYRYYDCLSWLLSPELKKILPKDSNIIRFQGMFQICDVRRQSRQAEERVYGFVTDDYQDYPEETSLQTGLKQYLLREGNPGVGYGIRPRKTASKTGDNIKE